jgi:hypothetical protein
MAVLTAMIPLIFLTDYYFLKVQPLPVGKTPQRSLLPMVPASRHWGNPIAGKKIA